MIYPLADYLTRVVCPLFLEHHGWKDHAEGLRKLPSITSPAWAARTAEHIREVARQVNPFRDGAMAPSLMLAFWLCTAAPAVEKGQAGPGDYGVSGLEDLALDLGLTLPPEVLAQVKDLAAWS